MRPDEGQSNEDDVARDIGDEDMVDAKNARRVDRSRDDGEQDQNARQRTVPIIADETPPHCVASHGEYWRTEPPSRSRFFSSVTSFSTHKFVAPTTTNAHERGFYRCDIYSTSIFTKKRSSYCGAVARARDVDVSKSRGGRLGANEGRRGPWQHLNGIS